MKLLHFTDAHFRKDWYDWIADNSGRYDLVVVSGDLIDMFGGTSLPSQTRWIVGWAKSLVAPLVWCSGNHDTEALGLSANWLERLPGPRFSKSGHCELLGLSIVRINWRESVPQLRGGDIVVSHAPPAGTFTATSKGGRTDAGDLSLGDALRSAAAAPWMTISGHVHDPMRWKDKCGATFTFNPGMGKNPAEPNHIVIDTTARRARLFKDGELADVASL